MSQRGKSNEHYWNPDSKGHSTAIHEAATHSVGVIALELAHRQMLQN